MEYNVETSKYFNKISYEYKRGLLKNNTCNTLVTQRKEYAHNLDLNYATQNKTESNFLRRNCTESALIDRSATVQLRPCSYNISHLIYNMGYVILKRDKVKKTNKRNRLDYITEP